MELDDLESDDTVGCKHPLQQRTRMTKEEASQLLAMCRFWN